MLYKIKALFEHQGFKKYFANTSWLFAEKIIRMIVGLFVGIWVARYLGPDRFGLLSYAQSFIGLFSAIATLGLDGIVVRELIKHPEKEDELIGAAFYLKLIGAFLTLLILYIVIHFTSNDSYTNTLIFIMASATIFQSFNVIDMYFQSKVLSKYVVFANILSLFISSLVKITLIFLNAPLIAFAWVVLFDSFVLAVGFVYFFLKHSKFKIQNLTFNKLIALSLLNDSKFIVFSSAVLMIQARIDQVMIKEFLGSTEVGYYSVAMRLIESFGFIPMMLKQSLYPAIESAKKRLDIEYQDRLLQYYRLLFLLFLVTAIPIYLFSENIVILLFGKEYQPAGVLLALMAIRLFFANMGVARSSFILSENLTKFSFVTMLLGTITNIVLNYFWIPAYGAKGAIVATIISFFVTIFAVDIFYFRTRKNVLLQVKAIFTFYKLDLKG